MKFLILVGFLILFGVLTVSAAEDDFQCVPGVSYIENECNNCFCGESALACTEMFCSFGSELRDCQRGTTWYKGCDQCWCTKMGTICTTNCGRAQNA